MKTYDIEELKGMALLNVINNMIKQLFEDNNEIKSINDITLQRIYWEIDSLDLRFTENGDIII